MTSNRNRKALGAIKSDGLNALALYALAMLTMTQRAPDGELLINGWHGLGLVCLALFGLAFFHAFRAIKRAGDAY